VIYYTKKSPYFSKNLAFLFFIGKLIIIEENGGKKKKKQNKTFWYIWTLILAFKKTGFVII
jgi:hypothetical protein